MLTATAVGAFALGVLGTAGLALGAWVWSRRRHEPVATPVDGAAGPSTPALAARANTLLVELDDDLRASERELALATGQYGDEATSSFTAALDFARREVAEAFRLRMTLDEPGPAADPDDAQRRVLIEIIDRCQAADRRLDDGSKAFDALRELESHVERSAAELGERLAATSQRLPAASLALTRLHTEYVGDAVAAVSGNVAQAGERLEFAGSALGRAAELVTKGQRPAAALAVRAAEEALSQASTLLDAVDRVGADLAAARTTVACLLVEIEADLAAARAAATDPAHRVERADLAAATSAAEQALARARAMLATPATDPLAAVRLLHQADAELDRALASVRDGERRVARAQSMLSQALLTAGTEIATADEYITTRRGAVASQPRIWLAEARRRLAVAESLATGEPVAALAEAQQASHWAGQARRAALADVQAWSPPGDGFAGGRDGTFAGIAGAILGGILTGGTGTRRHGHFRHGGWWAGGGWAGGGWDGDGWGGDGGGRAGGRARGRARGGGGRARGRAGGGGRARGRAGGGGRGGGRGGRRWR